MKPYKYNNLEFITLRSRVQLPSSLQDRTDEKTLHLSGFFLLCKSLLISKIRFAIIFNLGVRYALPSNSSFSGYIELITERLVSISPVLYNIERLVKAVKAALSLAFMLMFFLSAICFVSSSSNSSILTLHSSFIIL